MRSQKFQIPSCVECQNKESLFCALSPEEKDDLGKNKGHNFFKKGQVIFYEGNYPHGLYCIHKGKVKISKLGESGKEQIVRFASEGELLGYRSILNDEEYKATATAIEDSYICHLSKDNFFKLLYENKGLSLKVIQLLSNDLKKSEQQLLNIAQKSVKERIAEALLLLKIKFGVEKDNALILSLSRREIGDVAGTTPETTIRTLSDFVKDGLISLEGRKIRITNLKKLTDVANID